MNELSKERIEYINNHIKYLPTKEYNYLVAIVKKFQNGIPFPANKIATEVNSLMGEGKALCYYKIGRFKYKDVYYRYLILPTILGYEYITKEKCPRKTNVLPQVVEEEEENENTEYYDEVDDYYAELSADTEERLSDYDDSEIQNMSITTFMGVVMSMPGIKPHPKQLLLKDIAEDLKVEERMDTERFIIENKLQSRLNFVISLHPSDEEIWCGKVLEYLKNHKDYV